MADIAQAIASAIQRFYIDERYAKGNKIKFGNDFSAKETVRYIATQSCTKMMNPQICSSKWKNFVTNEQKEILQAAKELRNLTNGLPESVAKTLRKLGPKAYPLVPELCNLLTNKNWRVRKNALWGLGLIGPNAWLAIPSALETTLDPRRESSERGKAIWVLGRMGPAALLAIPAIVQAMMDCESNKISDDQVFYDCDEAIDRILVFLDRKTRKAVVAGFKKYLTKHPIRL